MHLYHVNSFFLQMLLYLPLKLGNIDDIENPVEQETAFALKKVVHVKDEIHVFGSEDDFEHLN